MRSVALLRGVNVGGHHQISMRALVAWLEESGFTEVVSYINSGNVVVDHPPRLDVAGRITELVAERAGFSVPVVVRTADALAEVIAANPYPHAEEGTLHVAFLEPDVEPRPFDVDADRWTPEEFIVVGDEVYLHLPKGVGRSVMVPRLALLKRATMRNWKTVNALDELARR